MSKIKEIEFDFLLPIGAACQTRFQIERFLRDNYNVKQPACFFDWIGLGGLRGVCKIIESNFLLKENDFVVKSMFREGHYTPIHLPSGFRFQHDFKSSKETRVGEEIAFLSMKENMLETLAKYQYLAERTNYILNTAENIGLVYHGKISLPDIIKLLELLSKKYEKNFYFINIANKGQEFESEDNRIICLNVDNTAVKGELFEWRGDNISWDKALKKLIYKRGYLATFSFNV